MIVTHCPRCRGSLSVDEYRQCIRCPHCGASLAAYSRAMQAYLGIISSTVLCGLSYWFFSSKGGWSAAPSWEKGLAIAFNGLVALVSATTPIVDWIYVSAFKRRGGKIPFLVAFIICHAFWYSPIGFRVQAILLAAIR